MGLRELAHALHEVPLRLVDLALEDVALGDGGGVELDVRLALEHDGLIDRVLDKHVVEVTLDG